MSASIAAFSTIVPSEALAQPLPVAVVADGGAVGDWALKIMRALGRQQEIRINALACVDDRSATLFNSTSAAGDDGLASLASFTSQSLQQIAVDTRSVAQTVAVDALLEAIGTLRPAAVLWLSNVSVPRLLSSGGVVVWRIATAVGDIPSGGLQWSALSEDRRAIRLTLLQIAPDEREFLSTARIGATPWSLDATLDQLALAAADVLGKAARQPQGRAPAASLDESVDPANPRSAPRSGLLGQLGERLRRAWYAAFQVQRWTIGLAPGPLTADCGWLARGRLLPPLPGGNFLADPFVVPGLGGRVLLAEWMEVRRGRGVIARVELNEAGKIVEIHKLIDKPGYHLSYPHVFRHDGALYCCPEASHSFEITLHRLSDDARQVLDSKPLLEGVPAVDPTVFRHGGRWWILCTSAARRGSNTHLHAYHAESLEGPWHAHRLNPIVIDIARARPAGRVFQAGGACYRPAQDCTQRYGGALRLYEIVALTPDEYEERFCWRIAPPLGPRGRHGVHTLNEADDVIVYDAYTESFSPLAWLYRLRERSR
ncbi:MAG TPA: hypothetical protein PKE27_00225 [Povalibacter sp.]|uniref:glucosamine inositolphosphorylceramide transferase family protein n=1 Tax=Povalibacter sp. TaxID=1962978 RepID=UPI002C4D968A|nr:hypothetical protein [Povalibacter sp.]HMN42972.1 hypothetical protein [Povalibacter sp.]